MYVSIELLKCFLRTYWTSVLFIVLKTVIQSMLHVRSFTFPLFSHNNREYFGGSSFELSIVLCTNAFNLPMETVGRHHYFIRFTQRKSRHGEARWLAPGHMAGAVP